jgi:hypothetical protein
MKPIYEQGISSPFAESRCVSLPSQVAVDFKSENDVRHQDSEISYPETDFPNSVLSQMSTQTLLTIKN